MPRRVWLLLLACSALAAPLKAQTVRSIVCDDLQLQSGATASMQCQIDGEGESEFVYRWMSSDAGHLSLLSSAAVRSPVFSAPSDLAQPLHIVYTFVVHTSDGLLLGEGAARIVVAPACQTCRDGEVLAPTVPQVHCPATMHLHEGESASILCYAADPAIGLDHSLQYAWTGGGPVTLYPLNVPNPTVVAPPVPSGQSSLTVPLTLAVTSRRAKQTTLKQITLVVTARLPHLVCPEYVHVDAGASTVLACDDVGPVQGLANYTWSGLWGTSTDPLSATDQATPTFAAPRTRQDTTFHYVVSMRAGQQEARHRVTVLVRGQSYEDSAANCQPMTLEELQQAALDCRVPEGHRIRWRGPDGPAAPHLTQTTLAAPEVEGDTTFAYYVDFCPDGDGACVGGMPWTVTVLNRKPPAVSCPMFLETYAGEPDLLLNCAVSGGTVYEFFWTGTETDRLSDLDMLSTTFDVPDQVEEDRQYSYTLTVTDRYIGSSSTDVQIRVLKRGQVELSCEGLDYYVYVGSADFPLQLKCEFTGAADPTEPYTHRWFAQHSARDLERLSSTFDRYPLFDVPDTLAAPYVYEYAYVVGARYTNPASAAVRVHVTPFPAEFDMSVSTVAVRFGEQSVGSEVVLDPMTGTISTQVRGPHNLGRMIFAADQDLEVDINLSGGTLVNQDGDTSVELTPQWSASVSCLAPSVEALRSDHAVISLRGGTGRCTVVNFGGELDLRGATPGRYSGNLEVTVESGEVAESYFVPVFATVVDPGRPVTTGPGGTFVSADDGQQAMRAQSLSIHPPRVLLTSDHPYGTFTVTNPSLITQEVLVQPIFGYMEASEGEVAETMVAAPTEAVRDLGGELLLYPKVFTLPPGQAQQVHYALREDRPLQPSAYATQIEFRSRPRRYVHADLLPVPDDSSRVALVSLRVQSAYLPTQRASAIAATLLSASEGTIQLEAAGGPFAGEVVAVDEAGNELGRRSLLLLTRRILSWPLDAQPGSEVVLNFVAQQGGAPAPAKLTWQ